MKKLIRWSLNRIPRPVLQRLAGIVVPLAGLFYRGRGVECPLCGGRYRRFLPYGYVASRDNALCPRCLSLERHRLLWLYLTRETDLRRTLPRLLHIAPEVCIMRHLKPLYAKHPERYVTADLESPLADMHFDVQRILRPGGWGILLSPVERDYERTYEDDTIVDPAERTRIFGQYDHRRIYGADYADRLREAGFEAADIDYAAALPASERTRYALPDDHIYVVYRH